MLAVERNRARPTGAGASDSGEDIKSPISFARLADRDMEDIRDNDDVDAVFSGGPPRAAFDADAIETSPNSSSNPSIRLSSASCAINPRCVPALAALVGDSGLDPSSLTLLDSLIKSNKSRLPAPAPPISRARVAAPLAFTGTL